MSFRRTTQGNPKLSFGLILQTRPEEVSARAERTWVKKVKDKGDIGQGLFSVDQPVLPNSRVLL